MISSFKRNFLRLGDGIFFCDINRQRRLEMSEQTQKENDVMGQAIHVIRAGRCLHCQGVRTEKQIQVSAGFGQGMKTITIFVCGNQTCLNYGKK